ncbi:MAG TPA: SPFH domain-containing protein [Acidimicrobiia bacterium]|nr:SPFH domain-containing protein [Acidimicrobiia bacterium]
MAAIIVLAIVAFLLFVLAFTCIKIVRPYQRGVVERLGRYKGTVDPGLRIIVPFVDRVHLVDMREQVVEVPPQEVITSDNVVVTVYAVVYHEATDAKRLMYNVANFELAVTKLAQTNLRNLIGDLDLDDALTSSAKINTHLRDILDDSTDKWGVRVVRVEIQRIDPPPDVVSSMHHQMQAERTRRAVVTEAQGVREAAVTKAEGEKQAAILAAGGRAEAMERVADAEKYRAVTIAEGEAGATRAVFSAIHEGDPTPDLLALKYLDALRGIADGRATKIFLPNEMSGLFGAVGGLAEMLRQPSDDGERAAVETDGALSSEAESSAS